MLGSIFNCHEGLHFTCNSDEECENYLQKIEYISNLLLEASKSVQLDGSVEYDSQKTLVNSECLITSYKMSNISCLQMLFI